MKLAKGFREFLSADGKSMRLGLLILLGLILILIGSFGGGNNPAKEDDLSTEDKVAEICSMIDGVGECRVMITYTPDSDQEVYAVLVLCDGADSLAVRERITKAFTSLYGIGSNRVEIQRLNKK